MIGSLHAPLRSCSLPSDGVASPARVIVFFKDRSWRMLAGTSTCTEQTPTEQEHRVSERTTADRGEWMVEKYYELETTQPHFECAS